MAPVMKRLRSRWNDTRLFWAAVCLVAALLWLTVDVRARRDCAPLGA